jgi:hypothetical protein
VEILEVILLLRSACDEQYHSWREFSLATSVLETSLHPTDQHCRVFSSSLSSRALTMQYTVLSIGAWMISSNISRNPSLDSAEGFDSNIAVNSLKTSVVVSSCFMSDCKNDSMV